MNIKGTGRFSKVEVDDASNPASISVKGDSGTTGFTCVNVEHTGLEPRKWKVGVIGKKFKGSFDIVDETAGNTERLTIYKSGKIGIGIKRPKEKLDVAGNINAKGFFIGDGSSLTGVTATEEDPVFTGSTASGITASQISDWITRI